MKSVLTVSNELSSSCSSWVQNSNGTKGGPSEHSDNAGFVDFGLLNVDEDYLLVKCFWYSVFCKKFQWQPSLYRFNEL